MSIILEYVDFSEFVGLFDLVAYGVFAGVVCIILGLAIRALIRTTFVDVI